MPGAYNICIYQNATLTLVFIWTAGTCCGSGTTGATPQPVDLTGYTAAMQFLQYAPGGNMLYDASRDIVLGGTAGTIALTIPDSVTASFNWFNAVYDLILTSSQGVATALLSGQVIVTPGVST